MVANTTTEISVKGKWVEVAAVAIRDRTVVTSGRWIKIAAIHDERWLESKLEDPESYIRNLKELHSQGFKADIFSFGQDLSDGKPKFPYHTEWDSVAAIRISSFEQWWKRLPTETQRNVRTSTKRGLVVKIQDFNDDLVRGIVEINNESPMRQGKPFWHYGKDFETVRKDYASFTERSQYIGAYFQEELIGFMKIVYVGRVAAIKQNMSKLNHRDKKPANAMIAKAVELCEKKNLSFLTYYQYRYGKKQESPLTEFKRRNGFEEILTPRFYVPLTVKGRVALASGLHRPLAEILPGRLVEALLPLRTKWYDWRHGKRV